MQPMKLCPVSPLPLPPVNIVLPLPVAFGPAEPALSLETPENIVPHRRRRSSTFDAIKNWALTVQPGSPAPHSPCNLSPAVGSRRSSLSVARDFISRRTSISHSRAPSTSPIAYLIETPKTCNYKQSGFDLTDLGYTSVFLNLAHVPGTPSPFLCRDPYPSFLKQTSQQKEAPKGLKKIKSLGMLRRNRRKSVSTAAAPESSRSHSRSKSTFTTTPKKLQSSLPPTLASDLLLRQFIDGGSLDTRAKRVMQERSREVAPAGSDQRDLPLDALYRDENGMLWRDEDEKLEREALLPPGTPESPVREWITFHPSGNSNSPVLPGMALGVGAAEERRGSFASVTSSLSLSNNIVTPADGSAYAMYAMRPEPPSPLSWSGSTVAPVSPTNSTMSTTTGMVMAAASRAQNKRNRRRPTPLRLNGPSTHINAFDDSFIPSPRAVALASLDPGMGGRRRSSTGGLRLSAPASCTEFFATSESKQVALKENIDVGEMDSASFTTMGSKKTLGMKKISKLNLKVKALFGGNVQ